MRPADVIYIRKSMGLTQAELGKKIGVHAVTIGAWEKGANKPRIQNQEKIDRLIADTQPSYPKTAPVPSRAPTGNWVWLATGIATVAALVTGAYAT